MTVPSSLDIRVFLKKYQTVNYYTAVRDSVVKDLQGKVYHIINKHTEVCEHETTYFSEALGYLLALEEKFNTSIEAFEEDMNKEKVILPSFE